MTVASLWGKPLLPISYNPDSCSRLIYQVSSVIARLASLAEAISVGKCSGEVYPRPYNHILYGLPAQEGIGFTINDIPDIGGIALARLDSDYVPACAREGGGVPHLCRSFACPAG